MLRQKTLLGETYVELTQGDRNGPKLPEGGTLPKAQVQQSVQLDEIFRTFDARTRAAFQTWMQQLAIASAGRGADLSAAIANLEPFAQDANSVLRVLDSQQGAVQQLVRNTGEVFGALSERQGQLQGLIRNAAPSRPPRGETLTSRPPSARSRPSSTSPPSRSTGSTPSPGMPTR